MSSWMALVFKACSWGGFANKVNSANKVRRLLIMSDFPRALLAKPLGAALAFFGALPVLPSFSAFLEVLVLLVVERVEYPALEAFERIFG